MAAHTDLNPEVSAGTEIPAASGIAADIFTGNSQDAQTERLQANKSGSGHYAGIAGKNREDIRQEKKEKDKNADIRTLLAQQLEDIGEQLADIDPENRKRLAERKGLLGKLEGIHRDIRGLETLRHDLQDRLSGFQDELDSALLSLEKVDPKVVEAYKEVRRLREETVSLMEKLPGDPADRPRPLVYQNEDSGRFYVRDAKGKIYYVDELKNARTLLNDIDRQIKDGGKLGSKDLEEDWLTAHEKLASLKKGPAWETIDSLRTSMREIKNEIHRIGEEITKLGEERDALEKRIAELESEIGETDEEKELLRRYKEIEEKQKALDVRLDDAGKKYDQTVELARYIAKGPYDTVEQFKNHIENTPTHLKELLKVQVKAAMATTKAEMQGIDKWFELDKTRDKLRILHEKMNTGGPGISIKAVTDEYIKVEIGAYAQKITFDHIMAEQTQLDDIKRILDTKKSVAERMKEYQDKKAEEGISLSPEQLKEYQDKLVTEDRPISSEQLAAYEEQIAQHTRNIHDMNAARDVLIRAAERNLTPEEEKQIERDLHLDHHDIDEITKIADSRSIAEINARHEKGVLWTEKSHIHEESGDEKIAGGHDDRAPAPEPDPGQQRITDNKDRIAAVIAERGHSIQEADLRELSRKYGIPDSHFEQLKKTLTDMGDIKIVEDIAAQNAPKVPGSGSCSYASSLDGASLSCQDKFSRAAKAPETAPVLTAQVPVHKAEAAMGQRS